MELLERMDAFFTARVETYDAHMLQEVEGCREGYLKMAERIPETAEKLLDLGCGTGLELDAILARYPELQVTGIDLTQAMLDKLKEKHPDKNLTLICADYFQVDFGKERYDCAISFQTMHHFKPEKKGGLYRRIQESLLDGGCYIECDYMVETQAEEDFYFAENDRLRKEAGRNEEEFCHYDTPCTVTNQIKLLKKAGFSAVELIFRVGGTTMLVAQK